MRTTDMIEKWLHKCDLARQAQDRYDEDPSPTNYSELKRALYERGVMEEQLDPRAAQSYRVCG